ncbi:unnamed protein product [Cladocopium goreaui]|uniref:Uncharacterized protein n=1 Tax=Cladocopium goreaui TaxID=2562237 RepID=A0A9P1D9N0_9DINO|nr:unnamed protein product [Cladocopium goreaui]
MRQPLRYRNAKLPKKLPAEVSDLHVLRGRVSLIGAAMIGAPAEWLDPVQFSGSMMY